MVVPQGLYYEKPGIEVDNAYEYMVVRQGFIIKNPGFDIENDQDSVCIIPIIIINDFCFSFCFSFVFTSCY